ncbi:MAG: patatin-like phospholipase family protein [Spirochaetia bacterium]|nr:patatin-like phospholipase family protein [Spirochaetia bacterium]
MKKILSIDGGGIRGLIPALVLAEIEKRTGKPICKLFDLMAGTSTGGILALALCRDDGKGKPMYSALNIAEIYEKKSGEIFKRSFKKAILSFNSILSEKYSAAGIERILEEIFEMDKLSSSLTDVLISSYDIQNREPLFFKSWKKEMLSVQMKHAARATSAAPTFFKPALIPVDKGIRVLVDGGVFANNPVVSAYSEYRRRFPKENRLMIVSLGTGQTRTIPYTEAKKWGTLGWALPLLSCIFDGVSDAAEYQMTYILGEHFYRLQTMLTLASDDLDDISAKNIKGLKEEALKLIKSSDKEIDTICKLLT